MNEGSGLNILMGGMGLENEYSEEIRRLRKRIIQKQDEIDDWEAEIEEMESDIMICETEIGELEDEIEEQEEMAKKEECPVTCYFDELVKGRLERYGYVVARDEWEIEQRWGVSNVAFCVLLRDAEDPRVTSAVYSSTDLYPNPDSLMTLVQR